MFIVERPDFRLTKTFYYVLIVLLIITGIRPAGIFLLLTMHMHFNPNPSRNREKVKVAPAELPQAELAQAIHECDLPPLPNRQGPYSYKGHPYYLYPNGDVDGFILREWWRIPFDEFKHNVDRFAARQRPPH